MSNSESGGGGEKLGGSEGEGEGGVVKDCVRSDAKRG